MVQTDKGTEFLSSHVQNFFKKFQIRFLQHSESERKV